VKELKLTSVYYIIKYIINQKILIDGKKEQLFFGPFGYEIKNICTNSKPFLDKEIKKIIK